MAIRKYKPTTPGRRGSSVADFVELTRSTPEKSLLQPLPKTGGRNNAGRITTRPELLAQVWGITAPIHTRTVDMHIAKLRHKLGAQIEITSVMRKGYVTKKA